MINLDKKRIMLFWFFSIMIMNIFIFLPLESTSTDSKEIGKEIQSIKENDRVDLKTSSLSMIVDPISINDEGVNNWAWAKTQPWCTGSGTALDPYLIQNLVIDGMGTENCINIIQSDAYAKIENCYLYNGETGIYLFDCGYIDVVNNEIHDMSNKGIFVYFCGHIDVLNNVVYDIANEGIHVDDSNNVIVRGNKATYCNYGMKAEATMAPSCNIYDNEFAYNEIDGLWCYQLWNGLISGNYIHNNKRYGISTTNADDNTFWDNVIRDNIYGVVLDISFGTSEDNSFYSNFFRRSSTNNVNDPTFGVGNIWDNGVDTGNYWDDYAGVDNVPPGGDGIGDTPYDTAGAGGNDNDDYPLYDKTAPTMTITSPKPGQVCYTSGPGYSISASDRFPFHTYYTLDGGKTNYTDMSFTGTIDKDAWDAVGCGQVTIRFYVDDKPGHMVFQDVIVYKESLPPGLGDGADDEEDKYFTLISPLGFLVLGGMAVPVGMILKHELKRTPKEKGRWITKAGNRIHIKGKKKLKKKK